VFPACRPCLDLKKSDFVRAHPSLLDGSSGYR
jgi:hypothetical protein